MVASEVTLFDGGSNPASRILCVDDDPTVRDLTAEHLGRQLDDVTVYAAGDTTEGMDVMADRRVDCVVSEYDLPDTDGLEFLRRVRESHADVPFVLFTDAGSEGVASEAISSGVTDYVEKGSADQYETVATRVADAVGSHRSRTAYRDLVEAFDDAVIVHDPETGDVLDVNRAMCKRWGYEYETACTCTVSELGASVQLAADSSAGDADSSAGTSLARAIEEGSDRVEWLCETADGEQFWADVRLKRLTVGSTDRVAALVRDISDRKRREQDLATFREAVEQAGHSIYVTDTAGEITYVNRAFEEITGYSAEEAIGNSPTLLKSGEHDDAFYRDLWTTILAGDVWESDIVNERKDGERYVVNQTIAPITDGSGSIVRFVAVNADITEQKRRRRQLESLYEATTEWLNADSREEVCEAVNVQLTRILEFDIHGAYLPDDTGTRLEPVAVSPGANATFEAQPTFEEGDGIAWRVFESGEPERYDDVRTDPDVYDPETDIRSELVLPLGDHGVLLIGATRIGAFDEDDVTFAKVLASGVTEALNRIAREESLQEQNARLEEFAAVVSHDLRNPLSIAVGHLDLLRETGDDAHLDRIADAHERMDRIIDDLLWLAREGRGIGELRTVALSTAVRDAWAHVDTRDATLSLESDRSVEADPDRLQQLFENLFRNSVEHGGETVTVRVEAVEGGFVVADDGPGIPDDDRDSVLEPGYSTGSSGTGQGLAIVDRIADAHGWSIVVSESTDGGARFAFRDEPDAERAGS